MFIIASLIQRGLILLILPFIFVTSSAAALEGAPEKILAHGSLWTVNIDGFEFPIQLYGNEQQLGQSGWVRRGIGSNLGKGRLDLKWRGHLAMVEMNIPVSGGKQARCSGRPARNLSFISGDCDGQTPFVMTRRSGTAKSASLLQQCERSKQILKSQNAKSSSTLVRCQGALREAYRAQEAAPSRVHMDARTLAQNARRHIPYRGGGGGDKADSVNVLDVPKNPSSNSQEGRWLNALLRAQNSAIVDLFNPSGQRELRTQESNICTKLKKCVAIFRQSVISGAAQKLGGMQ